VVLGKLWLDKKHNIVYFTPLGKEQDESWWLGSFERLKKYMGDETTRLLETGKYAFVDLTLL